MIGFDLKSEFREKIRELSSEYWNYKRFYRFPSDYKGCIGS